MNVFTRIIRKALSYLFKLIPLRNYILIETIPDFSDNPKYIFDEMVKRGINNKYRLIWYLYKEENRGALSEIKNIKYVSDSNIFGLLYYRTVSKCIISGNRFVTPLRKKQISFFLTHGTAFKSVRSHYNVPASIDYCLIAGPEIADMMSYEINYDKAKIFSLGYPRNDALTNSKVDAKAILKTDCKKVIVWYPTFRQHNRNANMTASSNALPIIHDSEKARRLNDVARENGILIVLKPHFVQDVSYVKDLKLSNIMFINDRFFQENNVSSYEFIAGCDALISDYSSIYYDYTLCNKPIGLVWEDIEEYKSNPGLIDNYEFYAQGGEKIYTLEDFETFISNVSNGIDTLKNERNAVKEHVNYSADGKNSERVLNFIIEKLNAGK